MPDSIQTEVAALPAGAAGLPSGFPESAPPAERLRQLLDLLPAARSTGELASFDPHQLSDSARIDLLNLLEQHKHWLDSLQQRVLAEIATADTSELGLSQEAVSLALRVPVRTAQAKLKNAGLLVRELPATLALLTAGRISARHAEVVCEQAWSLPAEQVAAFEASAVARAADQTVSQLRQAARRAVARIDPDVPSDATSTRSPVARWVSNRPRTAWCCCPSCSTHPRAS